MEKNQGNGTLRTAVVSGLFWSYAEKISAQLISFVVSILLARKLAPAQHGAISLLMVLIAICDVMVDSGFSSALVQKKKADEADFSTVFWFSLGVSAVAYIGLFFMSPLLERWYNIAGLASLVQVMAIKLPIGAVNSVQRAYVTRRMEFRRFFFSTLIGTILSAVIGILLAYRGFGAWALVAQYLSNSLINTLVLWITVHWRPMWVFSWSRFRALYSFGVRVLGVSLLDTIYENLRSLIIGKRYSAQSLAYYNRGRQFPDLVMANIDTTINTVLFSVMSKKQDDPASIKNMVRRSIKTSMYLLSPLLVGLFVIAKPLVLVLLTETWLACVPILQIYCISYLFKPFQAASLQVVKAMGRSDIFLKQNLIKKAYGVLLIAFAVVVFNTIEAIAISYLISVLLNSVVNFLPCRKMLNYSIKELISDVVPVTLLPLGMYLAIAPLALLSLSVSALLCTQVAVGIITYIALSIATKNDSYAYLVGLLKSFLRRSKHLHRSL